MGMIKFIIKIKEASTGVHGWLSRLNVQLLTPPQVMISRFVGSSPALGYVLIAQSLLGIFSLPLSAPPLLMLSFSLKINKYNLKEASTNEMLLAVHHTVSTQ